METTASMNKQGQIYIPKKVQNAIGLIPTKKIIIMGDVRSIFIFPHEMPKEEALEALEFIKANLKRAIKIENREKLITSQPPQEELTNIN